MFFGHCTAGSPFQDWESQQIEMPEAVLGRCLLTDKGLERAQGIVDGNAVEKVVWFV